MTRKFGLSADAGFTTVGFASGPDTTSATGGLSARYSPRSSLGFTLGYKYSVEISTFTNFYEDHRANLDANYRFARRWEATLKTSYDFLDFSGPNTNADGSEREDSVIQTTAGLSFEIFTWLRTKAEYQMDYRDSNAVDPITGSDSADFLKQQVHVGIDAYY
jgi:hypothetical protein